MHVIDYPEALEMAKAEIAKEGEDFIYENRDYEDSRYCCYVANGAPSCLVGRILINNSIVEQDALAEDYNDELFDGLATMLQGDFEVEFTPKARKFLTELQASQDHGDTWGEALQIAKHSVRYF